MLKSTAKLLQEAQVGGYAVGAFNVYNLEGALAVAAAAEAIRSPAMLQIYPSVLKHGGPPLIALCIATAHEVSAPMAIHLDHSSSPEDIRAALAAGVSSVMADGSHLPYADNVAFAREIVDLAHAQGAAVEAELGRLTGTEDSLTVPEYEAKLTDPEQAADFVDQTNVDALAVCVGNVHGPYPDEPRLDFDRLAAIQKVVSVPLVLHGTSGLPDVVVRRAIKLGVCKFNVNTEVRQAYLRALKKYLDSSQSPDLLELMQSAIATMKAVIFAKLQLFGSVGKG